MTTIHSGALIRIELGADGTGEVTIGGQREHFSTGSLDAARRELLTRIRARVDASGAPVRFVTTDPEGTWELQMQPDGRVEEFRGAAEPEPAPEPTLTPSVPAYDSGHVLSSIVPVTRIARSTKGFRSTLGLRPGKRELAERSDRDLICTPFGRPVTIVVADPRGGSGKTTTSLLLAGAFGRARGGGVLALENHELRGTMHLRTETHASSSTIRELLAARISVDLLRLGDLSRFVRHQVAGQYDVLVSATNSGRALRRDEFDLVHEMASRMYQVIIVDTANNELAENFQAAIDKADALVVPLKWRNDYSLPAIEMLEDLQRSGDAAAELVSRTVVVATHGEGDLDFRCQAQLKPYFAARTQAVIEIAPDRHIAEGNAIQHDQLNRVTRRQSDRLAAEVARAIRLRLREEAETPSAEVGSRHFVTSTTT